jgi:S-DNA-T family DNA segregation ATPase FtsK/SpoIIIE
MRDCAQCGFDYDSVPPTEVPRALGSFGEAFRAELAKADAAVLRRRPGPEVWSALEYACHVRDVLFLQRERLYLALVEDTPSFASLHRDERVVLARYNAQDPEVVANQIVVAAQLAAGAFAELDDVQWRRTLIYNWPEPGQKEDVRWLAAHTIHEGRHHRADFATVLGGHPPGGG